MNIKRPLTTLSLLSLVACGSVPTRTFTVDAIDADNRRPWPCLVVVDQDWVGAEEKQQFVNLTGNTPLTLELTFEKPEIQIEVAPVRVENGKVNKVPRRPLDSVEETGRQPELRMLRPRDANKQLFVITR